MPNHAFPSIPSRYALTIGIAICLILSCTTCGCLSFSPGPDDGAYQPSTFEPTVRPTHIPAPSPTMICVLPGDIPPVNTTTACSAPPL